ncbi:MAG: hypothetical protein EOO01_12990 [Chitinophagaceae bacterium]|nr:MAG: hypothetical protein EOO01_12990 [Chitinophagaceae bacterium]
MGRLWEDFIFKSYESLLKKPKTIGFSDVGAFLKKVQHTRDNFNLKYTYSMPAPGAKAKINFPASLSKAVKQIPKK